MTERLELVPWKPDEHLPLLRSWLHARGLEIDHGGSSLYPKTGFVAGNCAVAFLYLTNAPGVAYLDGLVTDPAAPVKLRLRAVEALCRALCEVADSRGVKVVWCMTPVEGLEPVLRRSGFQLLDAGFACFARSK